MRLKMKYDIPHFNYMDEYMISIIKMMDIYDIYNYISFVCNYY